MVSSLPRLKNAEAEMGAPEFRASVDERNFKRRSSEVGRMRVAASRRVLQEMNDKADRAIDD